ncbi:MAG: hypothetical protein SAJ37_18160 [Oscillatoria sp. PMC 1068.18]|nr:hypothetical protein [Oscillatoria sp. PMC 1076.18]MEC4990660.1 hypothetical protein [Oscillatoria sp. PMC 1068.18]
MTTSATGLAATALTATLIVSGFFNVKLNKDLQTTRSGLENTQFQLGTSERESEKIKQEILSHQEEVARLKTEAEEYQEKINRYKQQVGTVGTCLEGVVETINQAGNGDEINAYVTLLRVEEECERAGEIIEAHRNEDNTDGTF